MLRHQRGRSQDLPGCLTSSPPRLLASAAAEEVQLFPPPLRPNYSSTRPARSRVCGDTEPGAEPRPEAPGGRCHDPHVLPLQVPPPAVDGLPIRGGGAQLAPPRADVTARLEVALTVLSLYFERIERNKIQQEKVIFCLANVSI